MAATDIQYGGLDPVLYTPDFSFLRYVLDKKTGQYEQGLKQASAAYNSLKKDLTDPMNVQRRDQYFKDAQAQLQQVASSDLSLQQNVNYANSIFQPLATDKAFAYDAYHTARVKQEMGKMEGWKNSDDLEIRKKYNPEMEEWLARDLNSIKNGKGDVNNYKVEGRSAFADVDAQDLINAAAKEQNFTTKQGDPGNGYIVSVEGGPQFTQNYNTFAENVLAANSVYQQKLGILGQNRQEKVIEKYKTDPTLAAQWANKSDKEIYADYASKSFNEHKTTQKTYLEGLDKSLQDQTAEITAAFNGPDATKYVKGEADYKAGNINTPEAQMYAQIATKAADRNNLQEKFRGLQTDYTNTYGDDKTSQEKLNQYVNNFSQDPKSFFSDLQFKNDITRFASIKAASYKRTVTPDTAFIGMLNAKTNAMNSVNNRIDDIHDNNLGDAALAEKEREFDAKMALQGKKRVKNADGSYQKNTDGSYAYADGDGNISYIDVSATQVNPVHALTQLKDKVNFASSQALSSMNDTFGAMYMLQVMGLDDAKVGLLRGLFQKSFNNDTPGKKITYTPEERQALSEAYTKMWAFSKNNNPSNTFLDQERANYANRSKSGVTIEEFPDLLEKAISGFKSTDKNVMSAKRAMIEYKNHSQDLIKYSSALDAGKQVVINKLKGDANYSAMFYKSGKDANGNDKLDVIDDKYITGSLKAFRDRIYGDESWAKDKQANFSDDDLANIAHGYLDGSIQFEHHNYNPDNPLSENSQMMFNYNGKKYYVYDKYSADLTKQGYHTTVVPYTSKDYKKKVTDINLATPIPEFQTATGTVQGSPTYRIKGDDKDKIVDVLGGVTPTNSNIRVYNEGTSESTQLDPAEQSDIRDALKADKDAAANVRIYTSSPLNGGGQAVAITMKTVSGEKAPKWSGKTFYFPISPTAASPEIFHVFDNMNQVNEFESYKKTGTKYTIDTFQAEGVKAEMMPTQPGDSRGTVKLWHKAYDPTTRTYSDTWSQYGDLLQYDLSKTTFPEIKENIYNSFIYPYVTGTIDYQKQVQAASNGVVQTPATILNSLLKQ
jgi:hypothetical protein